MSLTLHIIVDNCPDALLDRCMLYLQRVKRIKYVNIGAGAQLQRGMLFAERVHNTMPGLKIIWRDLRNPTDPTKDDTGALTMTPPDALYGYKVKPYLQWFQKNKIIFMPDNESSGDNHWLSTIYVPRVVTMLNLLHADGLQGAVCRFATGNIADGSQSGQTNQYPLLKPIFDAMNAGDCISPNEYSNKPSGSSAGHLFRYKRMWDVAGRPLETTIGEAGIAVDYDPGKGYQTLGMADKPYADYLLSQDNWYGDGVIDRAVYLVGGFGWESFQLREGFLAYLEDHYEAAPQPPQPPLPLPAFPSDFNARAKDGLAVCVGTVNIRSKPAMAAGVIATIHPDEDGRYIPLEALRPGEKVEMTVSGKTALWQPVERNGVQGWLWSGVLAWKDKPAPPAAELTALKLLHAHVTQVATRTRSMSLELAGISDDLLKDAELLETLIKANGGSIASNVQPEKESDDGSH